MPILSFVVPVYNVEQYLARCLDSIFAQKFSDFEVIAVDDGSTDKSPEILELYRRRHPEQLFVFRKENGGLSDARNFGLERAKGEYLAFVDSDDFILPDFAPLLVEKMEKENLDLVLFDFFYAFENGKVAPAKSLRLSADSLKKELLLSPPMAWLRLYRRSLLGAAPFRRGIYYEDLEMTPRMLLKTNQVGYLPQALYGYYQRSGSIMQERAFSEKWLDIFPVLSSVREHFEKAGALSEMEAEVEFLYIEHLLRSAALRFSASPEGRKTFPRLREEVGTHFPHWKRNPYLKKSSPFFRLVTALSAGGHVRTLALLKKLKG